MTNIFPSKYEKNLQVKWIGRKACPGLVIKKYYNFGILLLATLCFTITIITVCLKIYCIRSATINLIQKLFLSELLALVQPECNQSLP